MPEMTPEALESADHLIELALAEDLQQAGDLTSQATVPEDCRATVNIAARAKGILSGSALIRRVYSCLASQYPEHQAVDVQITAHDGDQLEEGTCIATVTGSVRTLLTGERTVLNFLTHLSGIASLTHEFVRRIEGSNAVILDTRKTIPGYRLLHKYAVLCGGGTNHRIGLFDGMLIKDNHLAARGESSVAEAVRAGRTYLSNHNLKLPVEVEVDTLEQLRDALTSAPDIVLLDNMTPPSLQAAVAIRNEIAPATLLEASGGITLESVACIAGTGVDRISIGGLTHSAPALDLGYDWPW